MSTVYCTSKAFTDALKALPGHGSSQSTIDEFVKVLCKDYQLGKNELGRAGAGDIKDQYVLLQGIGAQRVYALRKSPRRRIKGLSCYMPTMPPAHIEITVCMAKKNKCPMLDEIYNKYVERFGPSLLAIYPRLDGCRMELAYPQPEKHECEALFTDGFGLAKPSIVKVIDGQIPQTATHKASPFASAPKTSWSYKISGSCKTPGPSKISGSSSLDKVKEEPDERPAKNEDNVAVAQANSASPSKETVKKDPAEEDDPREAMRQQKRQLAIQIAQLLVLADPEVDDLDDPALAQAEAIQRQAAEIVEIVKSLKRRRED